MILATSKEATSAASSRCSFRARHFSKEGVPGAEVAHELLFPSAHALLQLLGTSSLTLHAQRFQLSPEDTKALLVGATGPQELLVVPMGTTSPNITL